MAQRHSLFFGLGQIVVVAAGVGFGGFVGYPGDPPHVFTLLGGLSLGLLAIGAAVSLTAGSPVVRWGGLGGAIGQGLYFCFVMTHEPFLDPPGDFAQLFAMLIWLVPLPFAGMLFARIRCWGQAAATALFLFDCVALITFNMNWMGVAGFLVGIRQ